MKNVFHKKDPVIEFANNTVESSKEVKKRGNPRPKKKFPMSFSVDSSVDDAIRDAIAECEKAGMFGVNRSDVLVYAFQCMIEKDDVNRLIKAIKDIKTAS